MLNNITGNNTIPTIYRENLLFKKQHLVFKQQDYLNSLFYAPCDFKQENKHPNSTNPDHNY